MYRSLVLAAVVMGMSACVSTPPEGLTRADMKVVDSIHEKVLENWLAMPYLDSAKRSATVNVVLTDDGKVKAATIKKSSGNVNFDNGLLVAVHQSAPYEIPAANKGTVMNYDLTFTK